MSAVREDKYSIAVDEIAAAVGDPQQADPFLDQIAALIAPGSNSILFYKTADSAIQ
jgi:hypothetical protein